MEKSNFVFSLLKYIARITHCVVLVHLYKYRPSIHVITLGIVRVMAHAIAICHTKLPPLHANYAIIDENIEFINKDVE